MDYTLPLWLVKVGTVVYWVCQFALLFPLWVAWQRRQFWSRPLQILFWVSLALEVNSFFSNAILLLDAMASFRARFPPYGISTWPLLHLQTNLHGLGHLALFYSALNSPRIRRVIRWWVPVLVILALVDSFYLHPFFNFKANSYTQISQYLTVLVLTVLLLEQLLHQLHTNRIEHEPLFWVCIYSLIVFAGTLIMGVLTNDIIKDALKDSATSFRAIFGLLNSTSVLSSYVFLTIAFWNCGREAHLTSMQAPRS